MSRACLGLDSLDAVDDPLLPLSPELEGRGEGLGMIPSRRGGKVGQYSKPRSKPMSRNSSSLQRKAFIISNLEA